MLNYKCSKCGENIVLINECIENKKVFCSCGTEYYIKTELSKQKLKKLGNAILTKSKETIEQVATTVKTIKEDYEKAEEDLYNKSFDLWSEKRLELESLKTDSIYKKLIIKQRLYDLRNNNCAEDNE